MVTENSEATALLSNGEADIAAVATNVASNFYHKTDGSIQMLAVNTMGVLYILEKGDSIQSMGRPAGQDHLRHRPGGQPGICAQLPAARKRARARAATWKSSGRRPRK